MSGFETKVKVVLDFFRRPIDLLSLAKSVYRIFPQDPLKDDGMSLQFETGHDTIENHYV